MVPYNIINWDVALSARFGTFWSSLFPGNTPQLVRPVDMVSTPLCSWQSIEHLQSGEVTVCRIQPYLKVMTYNFGPCQLLAATGFVNKRPTVPPIFPVSTLPPDHLWRSCKVCALCHPHRLRWNNCCTVVTGVDLSHLSISSPPWKLFTKFGSWELGEFFQLKTDRLFFPGEGAPVWFSNVFSPNGTQRAVVGS